MRAALLLLLVGCCAAKDPTNCDLGDPAGLSSCIKQLLIDARPIVAQEADPLLLPDYSDGELTATNAVIHGIADYSIDHVTSVFWDPKLDVTVTMAWPHLRGELDVTLRKCKKLFPIRDNCDSVDTPPDVKDIICDSTVCDSVNATVGFTVRHTDDILATTLNVGKLANGNVTVNASNTKFSLYLPTYIEVTVNLQGDIVNFLRLFGYPTDTIIIPWVANKWWTNSKGKIAAKARDALDKVIRKNVSTRLSQLLRF